MDFFFKKQVNDSNLSCSIYIRGQRSCRSDVPSLIPVSGKQGQEGGRPKIHNRNICGAQVCEVFLTNRFQIEIWVLYDDMCHHLSHYRCDFLSTSPRQIVLTVLYPQCLEQYLVLSSISVTINGKKGGKKGNPNKDPILILIFTCIS